MYKRIILILNLAPILIGIPLALANKWNIGITVLYLTIYIAVLNAILKILDYYKLSEKIDPREERSVRTAYFKKLKEKIEKERKNKGIDVYITPSLRIREKRKRIERESNFAQDSVRENKEPLFIYKTISIKDIGKLQHKDKKGFSVVADSGMGKTMLLDEIALNIADKDKKTELIPVLFHFSELLHVTNSDDIKKKIIDKFLPAKAEKYIGNWFDKNQMLLLIDGLDQVVGGDTNFLKNILDGAVLGGNRVIFFTRPFAYSMFEGNLSLSDNYQYIEIEAFNTKQIQAYLKEDYEEISQILSFKQQLLSIPILLSHIKVLHQEHLLQHVKVRADLYREIINKMFEHEKSRATPLIKKYSKKDLEHFFKKLSYHTLSSGNINRFSRSIPDGLLKNIGLNREDFNSLLQVGIVQEIVEGDSEEIIFRHQSFQEYFASLELKEKILTHLEINRDAIINHIEYMYWDNVWQFLVGSLKVESVKELIEYIKKHDSLLAVLCLAESKANIEFMDILKDKNIDIHSAAWALAKIGTEKAVDQLIGLLADKHYIVRVDAARALGKIGSKKAIDPLIGLLADKDHFVSRNAASALGKIGSEKAVDSLIGLLADANTDIRGNAAFTLGEIGSKKAVEPLIELLTDKHYIVRESATDALGKIGSEKAVNHLIRLLTDKYHIARQSAAMALGEIDSKKAVEPLIELLTDKYYIVRESVASALGKIGSKKAVDPLMGLLNDKVFFVRISAAFALGKIKTKKATNFFIGLLADKNPLVRSSAAFALGKFSSEKAVDSLIGLLADADPLVRGSAAHALGQIGTEKAIDHLIRLLADADIYVRGSAADALGQIGSEKAVDSLIPLLADADTNVRRSAASAFGQIGSEKAVDSLIPLLTDANTYVRISATWALQNISIKLSQLDQDKLVNRLSNRTDKDSKEVIKRIKQSTGRRFIRVLKRK
ncbi:MAG: hypothetical protein A2Z50_07685 [Nitrospirae bacterium RBG_19FT_COMBO_42_15]|nr:MAG: hypothetical protein A2Z50_07685 [Nitrospirae bacterium RBG_19FT_COMBO_42_15]